MSNGLGRLEKKSLESANLITSLIPMLLFCKLIAVRYTIYSLKPFNNYIHIPYLSIIPKFENSSAINLKKNILPTNLHDI